MKEIDMEKISEEELAELDKNDCDSLRNGGVIIRC